MKIERKAVFELLKSTPLFCDLEEQVLDWLAAQFQLVVFHDKENIFTEGDLSEDLYLVYEGKILLSYYWKKENIQFALLKRGDVFGEESFLFDDPRSLCLIISGIVKQK